MNWDALKNFLGHYITGEKTGQPHKNHIKKRDQIKKKS